jgi:hypothetical protein
MYIALGVLAAFTGIWAGVWVFARKRGATHIIAGGGGFLITVAIFGLGLSIWVDSRPKPAKEPVAVKSPMPTGSHVSPKKTIASLNIPAEELFARYELSRLDLMSVIEAPDKQRETIDAAYIIRSHTMVEGAERDMIRAKTGIFRHAIVATIGKDDRLVNDVSVILASGTDQSELRGADFLMLCRVWITALVEMPHADAAEMLGRLERRATTQHGAPAAEIVNGVRFSLIADDRAGVWFIAAPA